MDTIERNIDIYRVYKNRNKSAIELANEYDVSRQRVYDIIDRMEKEIKTAEDVFKSNGDIVYPAIRKFLNEKRMKISDLCYAMGVDGGPHSAVRTFLKGKSKGNIDLIRNILIITKMDFYDAFSFPKDYMKKEDEV